MAIAGELKPTDTEKVVLEAWSQGFMIGALVIMCGITLANMRRKVLLHRLILIELVLAVPNGFFMFFEPPAWGWFLSSTVVPLIASWTLHNFIAWMKNKPFLGRRGNFIYLSSILLAQPYWVLEIYANFAYFNGINSRLFIATRPYEAAFRDPWWIFTIGNLFWNIKFQYELGFMEIVQASPRFGILLGCMCLSVVFIIVDLLSVTPVIPIGVVNPFWKFAFVFKCFTDSIILDDFKTALDKLQQRRISHILPFSVLEEATSCGFNESRPGHSFYGKTGRCQDGPSVVRIEAVGGHDHIALSDVGGLCTPSPVVMSHKEIHRK
ncbi:hypothetical protein BU24DRAFT_428235 [Aaosphaeria arxii CBS 175.79]|uniref:Uncharacterized protein n=1 Tax=Aaosphaeria arxii CBS 175.79 TaxID=1450172 RepID=A0A6A5XBK1_9PLEO|nr:uncharacterized protein BU24DRAFT_428235 [Aaosphaeria arxii CBS 175.79]KAF2010226.1 hypothetical protein BU24DRAFT_428235 [Aaosphaeria arxii CBS 175.79]